MSSLTFMKSGRLEATAKYMKDLNVIDTHLISFDSFQIFETNDFVRGRFRDFAHLCITRTLIKNILLISYFRAEFYWCQ